MARKLACLHAHESNIGIIQEIAPGGFVLEHYVDPGLIAMIGNDPGFASAGGGDRVLKQLEWMAAAGADAILITCTHYIALLDESRLAAGMPAIVKIDEPFIQELCRSGQPQLLLFSNPATVEGTMARLHAYAGASRGETPAVRAEVIPDLFPLIMAGRKEEYEDAVTAHLLRTAASEPGLVLSVAQLSMAGAAERAGRETGRRIGHPLRPLARALELLAST
ncbi:MULTISPECIES: hypothetical protein [unclassified Paenibacillus]|uniref:hypothetical protein n=1 Tax=unclassified Paenibacillus TaxID=185978 RepID=UPI0009566173|nr:MULTISPECIES: hypothetical protein [unclassified Paenibacillus]ASS67360.1 hypothetical protein CIC07_15330 [Paenibacillus sp. RUD330]SIQ80059.1 hypothetical protein SAMN05880555_2365 [Paenibacillus sp. RU4X]SIR01455.1 hypothetical protein SAMN05880570_2364 [Paenibacillus sp. RU4T]